MSKFTKLHDHKFKKGKFLTPFNYSLGDKISLNSWYHERLPEYLWLVLIVKHYGRKDGLDKATAILKKLNEIVPELIYPSWFRILLLPTGEQTAFFKEVKSIIDINILYPLVVLGQYVMQDAFEKAIDCDLGKPEELIQSIVDALKDAEFHQSEMATDIRYLVVIFRVFTGKMHLNPYTAEALTKYARFEHSDEEMRELRPSIRNAEMPMPENLLGKERKDIEDLSNMLIAFWDTVSRGTECELFHLAWDREELKEEDYIYIETLHEIFNYLIQLQLATQIIDKKMQVVISLSFYIYKRMFEVFAHDLFNAISGRSSIRCMIECYIMLKYLLKNENEHADIWGDFQLYGAGQMKLVAARKDASDSGFFASHIEYDYLGILAGEYRDEMFVDMDTSYFDKKNIRKKAEEVAEKELYGLFYDYDSQFEHVMWGAIRESVLIKCNSPAHQFHCIPDIEMAQILPSVWKDCKVVMEKVLLVIDDLYGIPERLLKGVCSDKAT